MNEPIIKFNNFSFRYQTLQTKSLKNINLEIFRGEKVLITGRSGSGKSSLLHCINGIIPFSAKGEIDGELIIDSIQPYETSLFEVSKKVGTILQDQDSQFIGISVGEDTAFSMENDAVPHSEMLKRVKENLAMVEMDKFESKNPYELSGGQKQRVSLAGILTASPEILVFDEPLANLDPASGKNVVSLISKINRDTGKTIIIVEHRIEEILECGIDRMVVFDNGEIVKTGKPEEVLSSGLLSSLGIREPLYCDMIKMAGLDCSGSSVSDIESATAFSIKNSETLKTVFSSGKKKELEERTDSKPEIVLKLEDICFSYGDNSVLKGISFDIRRGEIVTILGNNGAGKSTLSFAVNGILKPSKGRIFLNGEDITSWSVKKRGEYIGLIMQNPNSMIVKDMIRDELELGPKNFSLCDTEEIKNKVDETLKVCELWPYRNWPVCALSYGQKKRVTIGSVLTLNPKVIIMDEPTAGQDYLSYKNFMKFVKKLSEKGIAVIMITHDLYLAMEFSTRSIVIAEGRKIADGAPSAVFSDKEVLTKANLREISLAMIADKIGFHRDVMIEEFIRRKGDLR